MSAVRWSPVVLASAAVVSEASAQSVAVHEQPGHISTATIEVDAPPAQVYELVTDYAHWPQIFTDIKSVAVTAGGRDHGTVRFSSRTLGHTVTVQFDNVPNQAIRFRGIEGPPGGKASGEYRLTPLDGGKRTRVTARLYMDVVGAPGWFVSDKRITAMRRAKLEADLVDASAHLSESPPRR